MNKKSSFFLIYLLFCLLLFSSIGTNNLWAQNCENKLLKAQDMYALGTLENIDVLVLTCLNQGGFTSEERIIALELLINTEITRDNIVVADKYTIELLKQNPLFKPSENDTLEFKYYFAKFRTEPVARIGLDIGINSSNNNILSTESIGNNLDNNFSTQSTLGVNLSGAGYYVINKNFELNGSLRLSIINTSLQQSLKTTRYGINPNNTNIQDFNSPFNFSKLNVEEAYVALSLPLGITYGVDAYTKQSDKIGGFTIHPVVGVGMAFHYFLSHGFSYSRSSIGDFSVVQRPISGTTLDFISENIRHPYYISATCSLGIRVISQSAMIQLLFEYSYGIQSLKNKNNNVLQNNTLRDLLFKYGYLENDLSLNQLSVQVSYLRSIFKPKKIYK